MLCINRLLVFYPPSREYLANQIAGVPNLLSELHNEAISSEITLCPVVQKFFDDGDPNFSIPNFHDCTGKQIVYIADWRPSKRYFDLLSIIPLAEMGPKSMTIIIPFMGSATKEREEHSGDVVTANVDSKLFSSLNINPRIWVIDLHTQQQQFYFNKCVTKLVTTMSYIQNFISNLEIDSDKVVIVFPDDGAKKRFSSYFEGMQLLCCTKKRIGNDRKIILESDDDISGKTVFIVDDLTRTGGTLIECAKCLNLAGVSQINIYVPHIVFPHGEASNFADEIVDSEGNHFKISKFYTTDSIVHRKLPHNFVVFPLISTIISMFEKK